MIKENATFELEVSKSKDIFCPNPVYKNPNHGRTPEMEID